MKSKQVLIDSSVWIEYFRKGEGKIFDIVDVLLDSNRAAFCGIVEMEILSGLKPKEEKVITNLFYALNYIEISRQDFQKAGLLLNSQRKKGITIPATDCLIAAIALIRNIPVLTLDKHFNYFSELNKYYIN